MTEQGIAPDRKTGASGIYFAGFRNPLPGNLLDISWQARELATEIASWRP